MEVELMKVIFHIDESEKWQTTLFDVKDLINYGKKSGMKFEIEILADGIAVTDLKEQNINNSGIYIVINEIAREKVDIAACQNALKFYNIKVKELFSFVRTVSSGIVELVVKQHEGYAYIKP
jgi:intracellular sulfur oxidation DsrE/DsrF family protein